MPDCLKDSVHFLLLQYHEVSSVSSVLGCNNGDDLQQIKSNIQKQTLRKTESREIFKKVCPGDIIECSIPNSTTLKKVIVKQ